MREPAWTDEQNDTVVAAYFRLLADDLAGRPMNKAAQYRDLAALIHRSPKSVEFKFQNISAVLKGLGETWLRGLAPAFNFQTSLEYAVVRWMNSNPLWQSHAVMPPARGLAEAPRIWMGIAPTLSNRPPPGELEQMLRIAHKFDAAGRDARNRALGRAGEALVLEHEKAGLRDAGRADLADQVRWVADLDGDGAGYDIASFTPEGRPRLIEVKTTNGWERAPFHISHTELAVADKRRSDWCLFRLWDFARAPKGFELYPPLDAHVSLTATHFRASFH